MACVPLVASQSNSHWTHVAFEIGVESFAADHGPSSTFTSTCSIPRSGAQATPATATRPALTDAPCLGTSIRDWVSTGALAAQPRGTQNAWNWSNLVSSSSVSHFVAETYPYSPGMINRAG